MPKPTVSTTSRTKTTMKEVRDLARRRLQLACSAALAAFCVASVSDAGPREAMQETIDQVIAVLNDDALDTEERRESIEKIAYDRFDLYTMSRLVLARSWKKFTPEQLDGFELIRIGLEEYFAESNKKLIKVVEEDADLARAAQEDDPTLPISAGRFLSEPVIRSNH